MKILTNQSLNNAKEMKNDEFYTLLPDIRKELNNYQKVFKHKIILCNCNDSEKSHFWKYFLLNFDSLQLKKLIAISLKQNQSAYKLEYTRNKNKQLQKEIKTDLIQNGEFQNFECIEILKEADIVITNPPFSLFREYVAQLIKYKKKFIIVGNINAVVCNSIFKLIKENKIWLGYTSPKAFMQQDNSIKMFGYIVWFTNVEIMRCQKDLYLYKKYNKKEYPKYDNYNAININNVKDIPMDYTGVMGVPLTFFKKYNPEQFEIINCRTCDNGKKLILNGKYLYSGFLIKNKKI